MAIGLHCESLGKTRAIAKCSAGHYGPHYLFPAGIRCVECQRGYFAKSYKTRGAGWKANKRVKYASDADYRARRNENSRSFQRKTGYHLKRAYGLSREAYEAMVESQGGRCAICEITPEKLAVDHDHKTGRIRGLLCRSCNLSIGHFRDSPKALMAAAIYLERNGCP